MKTEKLAQWAEIISSLVVVVTLVFLIHEVQRNTKALERQSEMDRAAAATAPFFEAPELASILERIKEVDGPDPYPQALVERYGLTYEEAELWSRLIFGEWYGVEADFDALGPEEVERVIRLTLHHKDNQLFWEAVGPSWRGTDFGAFVDSIAAEIEAES